MARDPRNFKLGAFVLTGLGVLLAAVIVLGTGKYFGESVTLYCYFDENVSGLDPGSHVSYRGVRIGEVSEIRLVQVTENSMRPDAPIEVRCAVDPRVFADEGKLLVLQSEFDEQVDMAVARGMRASINWQNISGTKYIALDYYPPSEQPVRDIGVTPREPYIPTAQTGTLADIQRDLATVAGKLARVDYEEISARVVDLLDLLTQRVESIDVQALAGHAEEAMVAVRRLAQDEGLHATMARMDAISRQTESATRRLDELLQRPELDRAIGDAGAAMASLAATTARLETDIPGLVARVEAVLDAARTVVADSDVPATTGSLRVAADAVGGAARDIAGIRTDLQRALLEFRRAGRSVDRLARSIEEDPGAILRGRSEPKE